MSESLRVRESPTVRSMKEGQDDRKREAAGSSSVRNLPPGISLLQACYGGKPIPYTFAKSLVLVLTFFTYAAYHASRKPPSIVKTVLIGRQDAQADAVLLEEGWAPFNGPDGKSQLGNIDLNFLLSYAIGMFFCGHLGDRLDLRHFLSVGMIGSGIFVSLFGMGYFYQIHSFWYYAAVSMAAGLFQATGWPSVVSIMANWYGKGKRGLVMGIWNAHTSVGNIAGTLIAATVLTEGWGWSFLYPGFLISALGLVVFALLVVQPSDLVAPPDSMLEALLAEQGELDTEAKSPQIKAVTKTSTGVSFMAACRIPGVMSFALCLFFSKLVAYVFLYWLPFYIRSTEIQGQILSPKQAGNMSILFDIGGVFGGIAAGYLSDRTGASASVAATFVILVIPCLFLYRTYGAVSFLANVLLMMLSGFFVNGPYALITTAVSADLGSHESLLGNEKALATVTAIIDGMGSIGAAVGPVLTGYISQHSGSFDNVFYMLYVSALIAGVLLTNLVMRELGCMWSVARSPRSTLRLGLTPRVTSATPRFVATTS